MKWDAERLSFFWPSFKLLASSPVHIDFLIITTKKEEIHPMADFIFSYPVYNLWKFIGLVRLTEWFIYVKKTHFINSFTVRTS